MVFSLREFIGDERSFVLGCFFAFQQHITMSFSVGIPDHHGLLLFFFAVLFSWTIRIILHGASRKLGVAYGIMAAVAMWSGIESIVVLTLSLLALGITWIFRGSYTRQRNMTILTSLLLSTILTIAIDTPTEQLMRAEYDKRSIVHVTLWTLITGYWAAVFLLEKYSSAMLSQKSRFTAAAIGAISCIFVMIVLFPTFFRGPTSNIDPLVRSIYLDVVNEFGPIFAVNEKFPSTLMVSWALAFAGLPICFFLAWRNWGTRRYAWCYIALLSTVFLGLAAGTRRWLIYCQFISIIPLCYLSMFPINWIKSNMKPIAKSIARPLLIVILCSSFWIIPILFDSTVERISLLGDKQFLRELCQYLNEDQYFKSAPKRILTSIYLGPLLLYMTPHEIVGTPAHRNKNGIIDTYKVMNAEDESEAHSVIKRRGIDVLLIGRPENGLGDFFIEKELKPTVIFHSQLWSGTVPKWLEPLSLPETLSEKVKGFEISKKNDILIRPEHEQF